MGTFSEGAGPNLIEAGSGILSSIFNVGTANKQMEFQERMRSTAYQTATHDMIEAGLNPALMYGSAGPAATPAGAMATVDNPLKGMSTDLANKARIKSDIALNSANAAKAASESKLADEQSKTAATTRAVNTAVELKTLAESKVPPELIEEIKAKVREIDARLPLISAETKKTRAETPKPEFFGTLYEKGKEAIPTVEKGIQGIIKDFIDRVKGKKQPQFRERHGASGKF